MTALDGDINEMIPMTGLDQQLNPAFSPDGKQVIFHAQKGGRADLYSYNFETKSVLAQNEDDASDFAPTCSQAGQGI